MDAFAAAFGITVGHEGSTLDLTAADPGNWTGGEVGSGRLAGSKFGISAAAYPHIDIGALTLADAEAIYKRDYWDRVRGDDLPPPLAVLTFDAAVNNGLGRAARWLQQAVGAEPDGQIGPATLAAVRASVQHDPTAAAVEFMARRMAFMGSLPTWPTFGLGWSRRLAALPFQVTRLAA